MALGELDKDRDIGETNVKRWQLSSADVEITPPQPSPI